MGVINGSNILFDQKPPKSKKNLSDEQKKVLKEAGDDKSKMVAASAIPENYSENKILYKKSFVDGVEVFEFSNDENDELFDIRFSLVGNNNGDYIIIPRGIVWKTVVSKDTKDTTCTY